MAKYKKIAIFLDDERDVNFIQNKIEINNWEWVIIRNYFDFIDYIDDNLDSIDLVSFDHDIDSFDEGGIEWTGRDAARYLQDRCYEENRLYPQFLIHSMNNIGKSNIIGDLKHYIGKFEKRGDWSKWMYYHTGFVNGEFI